MYEYPIEKYHFFTGTSPRTGAPCVIAVSTYAGRTVRGVATCDPTDKYDFEKGKKLAAARCNAKVAERRAKAARRKYTEAYDNLADAQDKMLKMNEYKTDAINAVIEANEAVMKILNEM